MRCYGERVVNTLLDFFIVFNCYDICWILFVTFLDRGAQHGIPFLSWNPRPSTLDKKIDSTPYKANKRHRNTDNTANSHVSRCIGVVFLVTIPIYLIIRHIKGVDQKTNVLKSGSIFYCSLLIKYIE